MTEREQIHRRLVEARNSITRRGWWQCNPESDGHGTCALLAIADTTELKCAEDPAQWELVRAVGLVVPDEIPDWNDACTDVSEVLAAFDKAIAATAPEPAIPELTIPDVEHAPLGVVA